MSGSRKDAVADALGSLRAAGLQPRPAVQQVAVAWTERRVSDTRLQSIERALVAGEPPIGSRPERPGATGARPNVAGLEDPAALLQLEADLVHLRLVQLASRPVDGLFDLRHLQRLHLRLYGAVYWSAGDLRSAEATRVGRPACPPGELPERAAQAFAQVERGPVLRSLPYLRVVERLTRHLAAIGDLHPFAVGNACALRGFASAWAAEAGFRVAWADLDPAESLLAAEAAAQGTLEPGRRLLERLVRPLRDAPPARSPDR